MKKQLLGVLAASLVSSGAFAQQTGYFGADLSFVSAELKVANLSEDFDPTALRVRGGVELNQNFAIEGVVGLGLQDDEIGRFDDEAGLDTLWGVNAVGIVPLDRTFSLFGKIGLAVVEYEGDGGFSVDDSGVMFGFGGKVNFNRSGSGLVIEYTILPDVEDEGLEVESDMISIGAQFSF